jgi:hypothetical protein
VIHAPLTGLSHNRYREACVDSGKSGAGTEEGAHLRAGYWPGLVAISPTDHPYPERSVAQCLASNYTVASTCLALAVALARDRTLTVRLT